MNQLATIIEYLERFKTAINDLLAKVEASSYYDRILNRFESLDARQQKWAISGGRLLVLLLVTYFLFNPLLTLWGEKNKLDDQRTLLTEMKLFNEAVETQPRPAPAPSEWQTLAASTPEEAANSLKSYLASLGFPDGSYQFLTSSNSHLQIDIPELNLRQAQAILYQIDGWYPQVMSQVLSVKVHPDDVQKLTMSMTLAHKGGGSFDFGNSSGGARRNTPRNVESPSSGNEGGIKVPPEAYSGGFDSSIPSERPSNPTLEDSPASSEEGLPDFEALENNEALDALPPPPPIEDDYGDNE